MNLETWFKAGNSLVLASWLLLWLVPKTNITRRLVRSGIPVFVCSAVYLLLLLLFFRGGLGSFNSLSGVMALFSDPAVVLAGWYHYLAFDLFVGIWIVEQGEHQGISHLKLIPILILTFLFGPVGYLCFRIVQMWRKNDVK